MADILLEVVIQGRPEAIYKALTEQKGLASWWTVHTTATPEIGSTSEFKFYGGQSVIKMKITDLQEPHKVYWEPHQGAPDWGGTRVTWDLTPVENGTKLLFGHRDYASTDGSFASVTYNWAWYIISLKNYIETGKGTPHAE